MAKASRRQPPRAGRDERAQLQEQQPKVQLVRLLEDGLAFTANDFMRSAGGIYQALLASERLPGPRAEGVPADWPERRADRCAQMLEESLLLTDLLFQRSREEFARHVEESRRQLAEAQERARAAALVVPDKRLVDASGRPLPTVNAPRPGAQLAVVPERVGDAEPTGEAKPAAEGPPDE